jgi:hypothetical protein
VEKAKVRLAQFINFIIKVFFFKPEWSKVQIDFGTRYKSILVQGTNRFWYKVQIDFGTRYKSILVQGTNRFWYKVQIDFGTRYKSILVQGTNRFWYKVQIDFGTRYKSILVQGTNRFWYKVQIDFGTRYKKCFLSFLRLVSGLTVRKINGPKRSRNHGHGTVKFTLQNRKNTVQ